MQLAIISSVNIELSCDFAQPSVRNKLGAKALKYLKKGKACDDQLLVDIVVDVIK